MKVIVEHKYTREEALEKVKAGLYEAGVRYGKMLTDVKEEWPDEYTGICSFKVLGSKIKAMVVVGPERVCMEGRIPVLLIGLTPQIEALLYENMARVLS